MEVNPQKLKWILLPLVGVVIAFGAWLQLRSGGELLTPGRVEKVVELPYTRLSFERLAERKEIAGKIELGESLAEQEGYESRIFYYYSEGKKISGQINIPITLRSNKMPIVVMARGYAPKEGYYIGLGTRNAAAVYARNGYITLSPDFLGYGESDMEDTDSIGARLYRPVEILDLLTALPSLPQVDINQVYLWGHSNGGQIMLSVAEILGLSEPRGRTSRVKGLVLWAPVSKPFPFNVLFYTDEAEDRGKLMRQVVADFEREYDVFGYSIDRYLDKINIPIILHQGTLDEAVPYWWSDTLAKELESLAKDITYYSHPGADHNMRPAWDTVVARDLQFFQSHL